tara:strand:- start:345 stop:794 length:450 start_codon:yes stop_codon:yes gene_type:complete
MRWDDMASKKAGKQRQEQLKSPLHTKRKRIRARLVSEDPELLYVRTVTVRVGDEVEILRGDFSHPNSIKSESRGKRLGQARGRAGIKSKVVEIDAKNDRVYVEGMTQNTADGKEEAVPIRPSNLIVTKLYEGDPLRIKRITERSLTEGE